MPTNADYGQFAEEDNFYAGLSNANPGYGEFVDYSGVYTPEPGKVTSTNLPAPKTGFWDSLTNFFTGATKTAQAVGGVIAVAKGTPTSNLAKQTGTLTEQQLAALRAQEAANASASATFAKVAPWLLGTVGIIIGAWVLVNLVGSRKKS